VKIKLNGIDSKIASVHSLTDSPLKHVVAGNSCEIILSELKDYEVIVVELTN
jgi:hypothetical protein